MASETRDGVTIDRCSACGSLWFDSHELDRWLTTSTSTEPSPVEDQIPIRGLSGRHCPRCHCAMQAAGWTGLVIERCPTCQGLFVEAPELAAIAEQDLPNGSVTFELRLRGALLALGWTLLTAKTIAILIIRFMR